MYLQDLLKYSKKINILYAEDDEITQELYGDIFREIFSSVDVVSNGEEAYDKYLTKAYDIVISDVSMPKMDGMELCKKIIAKNTEQSIIISTAHNESEYINEFTKLGINTFILKPIQHDELMSILFNTSKHISDTKNTTY